MLTKESLQSDLKDAMRAGDDVRKRTLRMALAAIKLAEVERRGALDEGALLAILQKEVKTRRESIEEAKRAGREDLIQALEAELATLQAYLPQPLAEDELRELVQRAIQESGASDPKEMGKVMRVLMPRVQGRADGKTVSALVRELLAGG